MSFVQAILCRLGFHARSRGKVKQTETGWKSVCRGCGRPMIKLKGGDWRTMLTAREPSRADRAKQREVDARNRRMPPPRRKRPGERSS